MRAINAVLAHRSPGSAAGLVASLNREFRNIAIAGTAQEVRSAVRATARALCRG